MKKSAVFLLLFLLIILTGLSFSYQKDITTNNPIKLLDGSLEYDFMKRGDENASKELYDFVLKELNMTPKQIEDFANITPEVVNAFYVDLNDDGADEIIGWISSTFYWGTDGYSLFVLQKNKNNYNNIAYIINFEPQDKVFVTNLRYNDYKIIKLRGSSTFNFEILGVGYDGWVYQIWGWKNLIKKI